MDECETVVCPGENQQCENTEGGYRCVCVEGYRQEDGVCTKEQVPGKQGGRLDDSSGPHPTATGQPREYALRPSPCAFSRLAFGGLTSAYKEN